MVDAVGPRLIEPNWNITRKTTDRQTTRAGWEGHFQQNAAAVSNKIAESITNDVFAQLNQSLSNAYKTLPTASQPLEMTFSLQIDRPTQAAAVEVLAQDAASLSPFKEWFATFATEPQTQTPVKSLPKFFENAPHLETEYFQTKMAEIGRNVEKVVERNLSNFSKNPANSDFEYKVEWFRKAEKNTWNASAWLSFSDRDNSLIVKMWLKDKD